MLITLDELNKCVKALPNPALAAGERCFHYRVPIVPEMPVRPLYEEPSPYGPTIRIATFEAKHIVDHGRRVWRWSPCDELVI